MPLTTIAIELSNGKKEILYYPSNVVKNYFQETQELELLEFIQLALNSIEEAEKRVIEKYGYPCIGCIFLKQKLSNWGLQYKNETVTITKIQELR
ncbi:MAG TPA: hypothetical protein VMV49_10160 [Candidatus Deferrimicrobium sp.]|nr:hypothetical protein [Candidatus Deferrimicrobium sp.]